MESATDMFVTSVDGVPLQHAPALPRHRKYGFPVQPKLPAPALAGSAPAPATLRAPAATINPSARRLSSRRVRAGPFLMLFIESLPGLTPPDAMPHSDVAERPGSMTVISATQRASPRPHGTEVCPGACPRQPARATRERPPGLN